MPRVQPQAELCCLNLSWLLCLCSEGERFEPGDLSKGERGVLQVRFAVYQLHMLCAIENIGSSAAKPFRMCLLRARCCHLRGTGDCPESKQCCRAAYEDFPSSRCSQQGHE